MAEEYEDFVEELVLRFDLLPPKAGKSLFSILNVDLVLFFSLL